ncbi:MAG: hypothetical protein JWM49_2865 [Microbacteriaceae bacterium]|nr:hypothetical protein [Microbacteriaceae bacterium]
MSAQKLKPSRVLGGLIGLVGFSVLAGVLVTAMVTPAIAVTSATAQGSINVFENLPDTIKIGEPSQQNQILGYRGGVPTLIATVYQQNRIVVDDANVSPFLKQAAVDGEDRRFYQHGGVDVPSIARALVRNTTQSSSGQSGSSTLDMQLVKNILVQNAFTTLTGKAQTAAIAAANGATIDRKLKEMKLAIGLDKKYTKNQILLGYLNIVGMGGQTYGVESAAMQYFGVHAKDVTLPEAASLIAIVQQPVTQNLSDPKYYAANKVRRDEILAGMLSAKNITQKQYTDAVATPIASYVHLTPANNGCRTAPNAALAGFACDYAIKVITAPDLSNVSGAAPIVASLGSTPAQRIANWNHGGYKVQTSIDLDLEATAQTLLNQQAPPSEARFALGAAADTVEVGTGRILAMAQNKQFDDAGVAPGQPVDITKTAVNYSTDQPYGSSTGFPTGSTFKVIDLSNWLATGHGLNDVVNGKGPQNYKNSNFTWSCAPQMETSAPFTMNNDGGSGGGSMTVKNALINSVNNAFMNMAEKQDMCGIRDTAVAMGVHLAKMVDPNPKLKTPQTNPISMVPTMILGVNAVAPLTMAGVAATVGAGGLHCDATIIDSIVGPTGQKLAGQAKTCNQAISPEVAAGDANAMVGSMTGGTSTAANPRDGIAIAGKTGTSPNTDQDWVMGTTTKTATAVWTGNVQGTIPLIKYTNPITRGNYYSTSRFNILRGIQKQANATYGGAKAFPVAPASMLAGSSATVPNVVGQTATQAQTVLTSLKFQYTNGGSEPSALPAGRVTRTDPATGSKVATGSDVTVYTSDGSLATTMPNVVGLTRQVANATVASNGFDPNKIAYNWVPGNAQPGQSDSVCIVASSNPAAGASVAKTAAVTLTVYGKPDGSAPPPGQCPN